MLILILIDAQHSRKAVFSFEKGSNCQNHSSDSLHLITPPPPPPTLWSPPPGGAPPPPSPPLIPPPPPPSKVCDPPHWGEFPTPTPYHYLENPDVLGYVLHNRISSFHCERLLFMLYQKSFQSKKDLTCMFEFQGSHVVFHI